MLLGYSKCETFPENSYTTWLNLQITLALSSFKIYKYKIEQVNLELGELRQHWVTVWEGVGSCTKTLAMLVSGSERQHPLVRQRTGAGKMAQEVWALLTKTC